MTSLCAVLAACVCTALPPTRPDTPPPVPIPASRLDSLKTMTDIVAASVLENGARAPMNLELPQLLNRDATMAFMVQNFPPELRDSTRLAPAIAWVFFNRAGKVGDFRIIRTTGKPALDTLAARTLRVMKFTAPHFGNDTVGVWAPYPISIAPYKTLEYALQQRFPANEPGEPHFTPFTVKPELLNRLETNQALVRLYPKDLRERAVGGSTIVWAFVNKEGKVLKSLVKTSSGHPGLDNAAVEVTRQMLFTPALNKDQPVSVWIALPINFTVK